MSKPNKIRTHTSRVETLHAIRYTIGLNCTPPWIRTRTIRGLNPMRLTIGPVEPGTGREIRTLRILILSQVRLPISPSPHIFSLGSRARIPKQVWHRHCNLPHPKRVNNPSLSSQCSSTDLAEAEQASGRQPETLTIVTVPPSGSGRI